MRASSQDRWALSERQTVLSEPVLVATRIHFVTILFCLETFCQSCLYWMNYFMKFCSSSSKTSSRMSSSVANEYCQPLSIGANVIFSKLQRKDCCLMAAKFYFTPFAPFSAQMSLLFSLSQCLSWTTFTSTQATNFAKCHTTKQFSVCELPIIPDLVSKLTCGRSYPKTIRFEKA